MSRYQPPIEVDEALFARMEARQRAVSDLTGRPDVGRQVALDASRLFDRYPQIEPTVIAAMARSGIDPDSDIARQVADAATEDKNRNGWETGSEWVLGGLQRAVGQVAEPVAGFVGDVIQTAAQPVKPVARAGFTAMESGIQEVQSAQRNIINMVENLRNGDLTPFEDVGGSSVGRLALRNLFSGERVDLGEGFFAGGEIRAEHEAQARNFELGRVGGGTDAQHAVTRGRYMANFVFEPGSVGHNVLSGTMDLADNIVLDPMNVVGGVVGKASKARRIIRPAAELVDQADDAVKHGAGVIKAIRNTFQPRRADEFLASDGGRKVMEAIAETDDTYTVWRGSGRRIPIEIARDLADTRSVDEVDDIFRRTLGIQIREDPTPRAIDRVREHGLKLVVGNKSMDPERFASQQRLTMRRLASVVPGRYTDPFDPDQAVSQLERVMINANMAPDDIARNVERMARAEFGGERLEVLTQVLGDVKGVLTSAGLPDKIAKATTRLWSDYHSTMRKWWVDEQGLDVNVPGLFHTDSEFALPQPHQFTEMINGTVPLPDPREIRRLTSPYRNVLTNPGIEAPRMFADWLMEKFWKPAVLLRGAWTVRVIGEEQARMAFSDLESAFRHPISFLAWTIGQDFEQSGRIARAAKRAGVRPRGGMDIHGEAFEAAKEHLNALSRRGGGWRDIRSFQNREMILARRGDEIFARALTGELRQLNYDPVTRRVIGGLGEGDRVPLPAGIDHNSREAVTEWFMDGAGRNFRREMLRAASRRGVSEDQALLSTREGVERYFNTLVERTRQKTQNDPRLMELVTTGKLDGMEIDNPRIVEKVQEIIDEGVGPSDWTVKGDRSMLRAREQLRRGDIGQALDLAVDHMFTQLMSRPTNFLSRSPAFRQRYWQRVDELIEAADPNTQQRIISQAEAANLRPGQVSDLRAKAARRSGNLNMAEVDQLSKAFGLEETKKLLYDLSERSQFFDISRVMFPFGEAWKEVLTRWARIGVEKGGLPYRRLQQGVQGGREAGFFKKDDMGVEWFVYPGSQWMVEQFTGIPVPLKGRLEGMSIAAEVVPGLGPVAQIPAAWFLPETEEYQWLRDLALPFGDPLEQGGITSQFVPAWLNKWVTANIGGTGELLFGAEEQRQFNSTVMRIAQYMRSTGYEVDSQEDIQSLMEEARQKATKLHFIRGAAQFGAPTAPTPEFLAEDKNGDLHVTHQLTSELHDLSEEKGDWNEAFEEMLLRYGGDIDLALQPLTRALVYTGPPSKEAQQWLAERDDLRELAPNTAGLFAPASDEFDLDAWAQQVRDKQREQLTPEEHVRAANARRAAAIYHNARSVVDRPNEHQRALLRELRGWLEQNYPGYGDARKFKIAPEAALREIRNALDTVPEAVKSDAGEAAAKFLTLWDVATFAAQRAGLADHTQAQRAEPMRRLLRQAAMDLIAEHPDFVNMYEQVFERLMADDEEAVADGRAA